MHPRISAVSLLSVAMLAACSTDVVVAPAKSPAIPSFSVEQSIAPRYIVSVNGKSAKNLADEVSRLGGSIDSYHEGAGIAVVSGLTEASAAQLEASGVGAVDQDIRISIDAPAAPAQLDQLAVAPPSIQSQSNPAGAFFFGFQWDMNAIHAPEAWAAGHLGSSTVSVAILDSGIDYDSFDLNGLVDLSRSKSFMNHFVAQIDDPSTVANEASPIVPSDSVIIRAFFPSRLQIADLNGHGTNVATQVSSKAAAFAGVTSKTKLMAVKVIGANGVGDFSDILNGVLFAADNGANVANMSLGGGFAKSGNGRAVALINRVFNYAKQRGMLIVVAAGNSGIDLQHIGNGFATYCDAPHVICVTSVGKRLPTTTPDDPAFYTNYGQSVADIAAPGGNGDAANGFTKAVWPWSDPTKPLTFPNDALSWVWNLCAKQGIVIVRRAAPADTTRGNLFSQGCGSGVVPTGYVGTSQASPHVAGLAALLIAEHPGAAPQSIKQMIKQSSDPLNPGFGKLLGSGRINVAAALGVPVTAP